MNSNRQSQGEILLEFKKGVKAHIQNRKELQYVNNFWEKLQNPELPIEIMIQCFKEEFKKEGIDEPNKLTKLHNFLYLLNKILESNNIIPNLLFTFWENYFQDNIDDYIKYQSVFELLDEINRKILQGKEEASIYQRKLIHTQSHSTFSTKIDTDKFSSRLLTNPKHEIEFVLDSLSSHEFDEDIKTSYTSKIDQPFQRKNQKGKTLMGTSSVSIECPYYDSEEEMEEINIIKKKNTYAIRFITIDLLIKKIALENLYLSNKDIVDGFIDQFPCFLRSDILIQKIIYAIEHYVNETNDIPIDLLMFFNRIIDKQFPTDIKGKVNLVAKINDFYKQIIASDMIKQHKSLNEEISTKISMLSYWTPNRNHSITFAQSERYINLRNSHSLFSPNNGDLMKITQAKYFRNSFNIFEFNDSEIALQLTHITNKLMNLIKSNELYPSIKNRNINAPNLFKVIDRTNKLTMFIIEDICSYDYRKIRGKVIEKYIRIAYELKALKNYNDLLIVISAINHMIIQRYLPNSWKYVNKKEKDVYEDLKEFVSFEESYKNIRNQIAVCQAENCFFTPYLGIILKRLWFIEEGNKYIKNNRLVNIEKIVLIESLIKEFIDNKKNIIDFNENSKLTILDNLNPKNEKDLIALAKLLEPSFTGKWKKSKIKRRTQTEGITEPK